MFTPAGPLIMSAEQERELERLVRSGNSAQKVALRSRLLLLAHQGLPNRAIAAQLRISRPTVLAVRAAFIKDGLAAVTGVRRRKRSPKVLTPEVEQRILDTTLTTRPGCAVPGCAVPLRGLTPWVNSASWIPRSRPVPATAAHTGVC